MKNLFKKIVVWVKSILGNLLDHFRKSAEVAVLVTDKLKSIIESDLVDIAVDLIPSEIDNIIVDRLRSILPVVIAKVSLAAKVGEDSNSNAELIAKLIDHLKSLNPESRKAFWVLFSAELNIALSDGQLSFSEGVILTQMIYKEIRSKR
jgi:hypothetical protein